MYRGRLWTMRQFAGFGSAEHTNERFRYLLEHGQTGLSTAFDLPTLMGRDSDDALSRGEVGREGVAVDTLADMEILFRGIPLDRVSTSMTINAPAAVIFCMYLAVAEKQGVPLAKLEGTLQNDILKEYIAQKEWIYPPRPSMRIITDLMAFCGDNVPKWNTISISGYHIREAGSTAVQELAFTLADGIAYVEAGIKRGSLRRCVCRSVVVLLQFPQRLLRGDREDARRAPHLGARHARPVRRQGSALALASLPHPDRRMLAVRAAAPQQHRPRDRSRHWRPFWAARSRFTPIRSTRRSRCRRQTAVTVALRTQQIIAEESGVTNTIDPLGGSYFVEALTDKIERDALAYIERIDQMGGMIAAIERGFPQKEIADASYHYQRQVDRGEKTIVGVNKYAMEDEPPTEILKIGEDVEREQLARLAQVKAGRDETKLRRELDALAKGAADGANLIPLMLACVRSYGTVQELSQALVPVFGTYREVSVL